MAGDLNFQASIFTRYSSILFRPDEVGDLIFNGVASRLDRDILSNGFEFDASYKLNDQHTFAAVCHLQRAYATVNTVTLVFPVDADGNQTSTRRFESSIITTNTVTFAGFYLQDEWKPFEQLTINFGGRLDFAKRLRRKVNSARALTLFTSRGR